MFLYHVMRVRKEMGHCAGNIQSPCFVSTEQGVRDTNTPGWSHPSVLHYLGLEDLAPSLALSSLFLSLALNSSLMKFIKPVEQLKNTLLTKRVHLAGDQVRWPPSNWAKDMTKSKAVQQPGSITWIKQHRNPSKQRLIHQTRTETALSAVSSCQKTDSAPRTPT